MSTSSSATGGAGDGKQPSKVVVYVVASALLTFVSVLA
ncbi:hypothetical protein HU200_003095 [Digitaria exilis]|uniref:Uncharacterized protein n=1 Tax=Digitaria exilis TaxID=1010633 RepID=A0A835KUX4_9POAL|nr:hypothetical protein HU200_003095 [Digitaria exilis]